MCWILTLAIPPGCVPPGSDCGLGIAHWPTAEKRADFPSGWNLLNVTSGMCACGLYEEPDHPAPPPQDKSARMLARYQRLGWSAAKIERALRDHEHAEARQPAQYDGPLRFRVQVAQWASQYGEVCVRAHWEGRPHEKPYPVGQMCIMSAEDFVRTGFAPCTVVRVRGSTRSAPHGYICTAKKGAPHD